MMDSTNHGASIEANPTQVTVTRSRAYKMGIATAKLAFSNIDGSMALRKRSESEPITRNMNCQDRVTPKKPKYNSGRMIGGGWSRPNCYPHNERGMALSVHASPANRIAHRANN